MSKHKFYHMIEVSEDENFNYGVEDSVAGDVLVMLNADAVYFLEDDGQLCEVAGWESTSWKSRMKGLTRWRKAWPLK